MPIKIPTSVKQQMAVRRRLTLLSSVGFSSLFVLSIALAIFVNEEATSSGSVGWSVVEGCGTGGGGGVGAETGVGVGWPEVSGVSVGVRVS